MNIYIAAPWKHKQSAIETSDRVESVGHTVVSNWFRNDYDANVYEAPEKIMATEAERDIVELSRAEAVIYLNIEKSEGKATELGFAIARSIPVFVIGGKQNNVFLHTHFVTHCFDLEDALERIAAIG